MPILSYDEALDVGADVRDYWLRRAGVAPGGRDEFGWADLVQFVTRRACECLVARDRQSRRQDRLVSREGAKAAKKVGPDP